MKIAVACEGRNVTEHFGHCEALPFLKRRISRLLTNNLSPIRDINPASFLSSL
jgi:hypothetical protein